MRAFAHSKVFISLDASLVFVCGGRENKTKPCGRDIFFNYASRHLTNYQFIRAETVFKTFENTEQHDILSIEDKIAQFSDCIIIILESESTFAELGAFAIKNSLAKILLPINNEEYEADPSFINYGPIAKINKLSKFKPVIYYKKERFLTSINTISQRLKTITREYRKRVDISTFDNFNSLGPKHKLLYLRELIDFFCPLTHKELIHLLETLYGKNSYAVTFELSILEAINFIQKHNNYYITTKNTGESFINFDRINKATFRTKLINFYQKKRPDKMAILAYRSTI